MATFYNQATLSFGGITTNSNVTEGEVTAIVASTKTAISQDYGAGDGVAYAISITNASSTDKTGITVTDDLGEFTYGTLTLTPLSYIDGSLKLYQNGVLVATPTVSAGPPLTISDITVPAGGNVLIVYEASVNAFADLAAGSVITNTATVTSGTCQSVLTATVPVRSAPELSISKSICPDNVVCGETISYTFVIQNSGNAPVVATDDVVLTDLFTPVLSDVSATYNGGAWAEGTNYTYDTATGQFTTLPGQITVPAATYTRDALTGALTVTPGTAVIKITGAV